MYEKEVAEIEQLIQKQDQWRDRCINLIASENVMSIRSSICRGASWRTILSWNILYRRD
jgi:glycine/serine hydroxymethyltransferase